MGFWVKKKKPLWLDSWKIRRRIILFFLFSKQFGWMTCRALQMEQKEKRA
jgi:hypothetical protein